MRLLILVLLLFPLLLYGQDRERLERAREQFARGAYPAAVRTLQASAQLIRQDADAALLLAASQFHANDLTEARGTLERAKERHGNRAAEADLFLGRIYHAQNLFAQAGEAYKRYLTHLNPRDDAREVVTDLLRNVANAIAAPGAGDLVIENLGPEVNSDGDEFAPIPSPGGSGRLYFSAAAAPLEPGPTDPDIYYTTPDGEAWAAPVPLSPMINTGGAEYLADINNDGRHLLYYRGNETGGTYLVDTFRRAGEGLATVVPDIDLNEGGRGVTPFLGAPDAVYFASDRPGGFGGLDLYRRLRLPGGGYGPAMNLGPSVNGPYDELSPFVARDGRTLYFSTNDPDISVGGFDVVRSFRVIDGAGRFTVPENLGLPINSSEDDTFFRLAPDTFTAFLSSNRKDGYGSRDIYVVYFSTARPEMQPPE